MRQKKNKDKKSNKADGSDTFNEETLAKTRALISQIIRVQSEKRGLARQMLAVNENNAEERTFLKRANAGRSSRQVTLVG